MSGSQRAKDAVEDHFLGSGLYRKAIVRLRSGTSQTQDHLIIDAIVASGKVEGELDDEWQEEVEQVTT